MDSFPRKVCVEKDVRNLDDVYEATTGEITSNRFAGQSKNEMDSGGGDAVKCVKSMLEMKRWLDSQAFHDLLGFLNGISTAIQGKRNSSNVHVSETMTNLLNIFDKLNSLADETPPIEQPQRFGNKAFRLWSQKKDQIIPVLIKEALPAEKSMFYNELNIYLIESFGNPVRIDYGTGHELSFVFFLCSLFKAEVLKEEDAVACGLRLFNRYLLFVRRLQTTYRMEPAGSQGVWSLDDYQFVPFIWGSAQLSVDSPFTPDKFVDENIINDFKDEYMFISCIDYINKVKTGHFAEHSNQLWSISAVPQWSKINAGLMKMYEKEILSKFPIIQHVYFGKLMSFEKFKNSMPQTQRFQMGRVPLLKQTNESGSQQSFRMPASVSTTTTTSAVHTPTPTSSTETDKSLNDNLSTNTGTEVKKAKQDNA